ncbi:hypothetical protein ANCDUO_11155 [Ancylostoma duodenale]|uniref:Uncharacterized protein n=1 Tax=Ancylostoma duodenale TaxID=51022 RepID=A0A0C2GC34_9BILA|nr:hypothetical protein ANCDUO_11155 [Ancylostoma duodenale]
MPATRKSSSTARTTKAYSQPTASVAPTTVSQGPGSDKEESLVIAGILEAEGDLEPLERVSRTEAMIHKVLNALGIEALPTEIYRMGDVAKSKARLIKCVLPSERFFFKALRNAQALQNLAGFDRVYIRRSMTREEREMEKELRRQAHDLNLNQHNGSKVYVVYRGQLVKDADIPKRKASVAKNF